MEQVIIKKYIEEVLQRRLEKFNLEEKYIKKIKENVNEQIYSLLYHWNDIEFRKAILITGMEEGSFYEPDAEIDIKNFVVVAIRNSLIEDIFSVEHNKLGLRKEKDEYLIKELTGEAIEYFKDKDFAEMSNEIQKLEIRDIYGEISKEYPKSFEALVWLGKCTSKKITYNSSVPKSQKATEEFHKKYNSILIVNNISIVEEGLSGYNEKLTQEVINLLEYFIEDKNGLLYVDCFKMISRNFKKLLFVIEVILENDGVFLTSNYLIKNSYVGKREDLYRAAHTTEEYKSKVEDDNFYYGLSKFHRTALQQATEMLFK